MANTKFQIKRSVVPGKVPQPSDLEIGELALNLTDKKIFSKNSLGNILTLADYEQSNSALTISTLAYNKANSAITLGTTPLYLGGTNTSISGLISVSSNTLTLIGNTSSTNTTTGT